MLSDAIKYWLSVIAIAIGTAWFTGRISSGIIFLIAGGAIFVYWTKFSQRRKRRPDD
jgi:membrane protein implicated in regulation of membrane protease activity